MARQTGSFECIGRDGNKRMFWFVFEPDAPNMKKVFFRVFDSPAKTGEFFEMNLIRCQSGMHRIQMIKAHDSKYCAMGIPDTLIPYASCLLKSAICSSLKSNRSDQSEWQTDKATKMWLRLVSKKLARYSTVDGHFICDQGRIGSQELERP